MKRNVAMVAFAAVVLTGCSRGSGLADAGSAPTRPTSTTTSEAVEVVEGAKSAASRQVSIYLTKGELLKKVNRSVPDAPRIGAEAIKALLAGPTPAEAKTGLDTAIPRSVRFRDLKIDGGVALVDLSSEFEAGGGTLGLTLRLAQVTCTLNQFSGVEGVRFALDGQQVSVFSGNGIVLSRPVSCASYRAYLNGAAAPTPPAATLRPGGNKPPEPVYKDGIPQVTVSPSRGPVGSRVRIEGYGFTDEQWRSAESSLWLVGGGGDCLLYADAEHTVRVTPDGHLTGEFTVPAIGGCKQEGRQERVSPGPYTIAYQCTPCTIGDFEVTPT
ncbi:MAG: GerMN domain-containing protein [Actinomycetota bacterium]|nr:GerMN domain-containing protein [Actinomycetota bacterium]